MTKFWKRDVFIFIVNKYNWIRLIWKYSKTVKPNVYIVDIIFNSLFQALTKNVTDSQSFLKFCGHPNHAERSQTVRDTCMVCAVPTNLSQQNCRKKPHTFLLWNNPWSAKSENPIPLIQISKWPFQDSLHNSANDIDIVSYILIHALRFRDYLCPPPMSIYKNNEL